MMARGFRDATRLAAASASTSERDPRTRTVSELTQTVKALLEGNVGRVWVEGELSNVTLHRSGHIYFTLKDARASLSCVMWRSGASRLSFRPKDGETVLCKGALSVYEPQGRYQLVADSMQGVGSGDQKQQLDLLIEKLRAEGLFESERKRPLPAFPTALGVVTSPTGAAIRDIVRIARRRMPGLRIYLAPCKVQGDDAPADIVRALDMLDRSGLCDVIICGRGGGSAEDLAAFNDETVARAVAACKTPVISAVGHEVDVAVTDLAADWRSATPSEAAEVVVPEASELLAYLEGLQARMRGALERRLRSSQERLLALTRCAVLRYPLRMLQTPMQRLDLLQDRLFRAVRDIPERKRQRLALAAARLEALSPLAVLARGFSITSVKERGVVRCAKDVTIGDMLQTRVAHGWIDSTVVHVHEKKPEGDDSA